MKREGEEEREPGVGVMEEREECVWKWNWREKR